ncbi:hypothetical protein [Fructobacillus durionis]|nr:hypothetical protein [Fructobacillus durionis]
MKKEYMSKRGVHTTIEIERTTKRDQKEFLQDLFSLIAFGLVIWLFLYKKLFSGNVFLNILEIVLIAWVVDTLTHTFYSRVVKKKVEKES